MKTVATAASQVEADLVCARLRAYGIESFLPDQDAGPLEPFYSSSPSRLRIQVQESDYPAAQALLAQ